MADEKLIEAEVFKIESTHHFHGETCLCGFSSARSRSRTEHITGLVRAVLEKAHTPSDDGHEALARLIHHETGEAREESEFLADAILAAGFRRTVQGEPTDAQVIAALNAYQDRRRLGTTLGDWGSVKVQQMRAALRAAAAAREEGQGR